MCEQYNFLMICSSWKPSMQMAHVFLLFFITIVWIFKGACSPTTQGANSTRALDILFKVTILIIKRNSIFLFKESTNYYIPIFVLYEDHYLKVLAAWSWGILAIFMMFPAPSKASSAAYPASSPYLAPTTFDVPLPIPLPISYTAVTTPS